MVNGIWETVRAAGFEHRIINTDTISYISQDWFTITRNNAQQNYRHYCTAAEDVRESFTPLISSTVGVMQKEYVSFHKGFSEILVRK